MQKNLLSSQAEFEELCDHIQKCGLVAFDTEFVSEDTFRPELCLLQFATPERSASVDPFEVKQLDRWWDIMTDESTTVVVHGGQAEVRFCLQATNRKPRNLVDIQVAEGMRSPSYPLSYANLVSRVLGIAVDSSETRTDWRRRPLQPKQLKYALEDVEHILQIWEDQKVGLEKISRLDWAYEEFERLIEQVDEEQSRKSWDRLSGFAHLQPRDKAVAMELCEWRENEAKQRNRLTKRILRDDILIELSKRKPKSVGELVAVRDMNRKGYRKIADDLIACIQRGLHIPKEDLPRRQKSSKRDRRADEQVLSQILSIALSNRCLEMNIARQLVGTTADLKHFVRWHVWKQDAGPAPLLTYGWRAEVCGNILADLLDGKVALRVADPESEYPLVFDLQESRTNDAGS